MGSCVHTAAHRMTFCFIYVGKFMFNRPALCKGAHMNYLRKKICCILAVAVFLLLLPGCKKTPEVTASSEQTEAASVPSVLQVREGIQTVLVLCLNDYEEAGSAGGFRNANRADFAMLLVIDEKAGNITSLQLNPDIVVPFAVPGKSEEEEMPLGQIFSYGSGGSDSCLNTTKAVSGLLNGVKVDHYLTFTKDAVGIVNDMIGGVTLPLGTDSEEIVTLSGAEAVDYFFCREADDVSNEKHMEQQRQYMAAMFGPFMACAENEDFLTKLSLQLGEKMGTGLTLSQLIQMFETLAAYTMETDILTIPGTVYQEAGENRFSVEQAEVNHIVESLFLEQ